MDSPSSSYSFSIFETISSTFAFSSSVIWTACNAFSSLSKAFTANHLFDSEFLMDSTLFSISVSTFSISSLNDFIDSWWDFTCFCATSINSSKFNFLSADTSTIGIPNFSDISFVFNLSLFFLTTSIILNAKTIGIPISDNCVVRYKFLSIFEASTTSIITSGFSFIK